MMESQDISSENLEKDNTLESNQFNSLNESQDFHLVDTGDEESLANSELAGTQSKVASEDYSIVASNTIESVDNKTDQNMKKDKQEEEETESVKVTEKERITHSTISESKSKHSDDEEIIQCTPPKSQSPSKIQTSIELGTTSLKRKAGSFDEPPTKVLKTTSDIDDLYEKKVPDQEEESCQSFKSDDSHQEFPKNCSSSNVIISETQDTAEDEDIKSIVVKSASSEENTKDEKCPESQIKDYEIDKNENLNSKVTLSEPKEEVSAMKSAIQSDDNSKILTPEKVQSDLSNATTDNSKIKDVNSSANDANIGHYEKSEDRENSIASTKYGSLEQNSNEIRETSISKETSNESHSAASVCKSRMSVEVIYDRTTVPEIKSKNKELVEIDEDGEKIVLDSSQEDSLLKSDDKNALDNTKSETTYKSCYDSKSNSDYSYKSLETSKESSIEFVKSSNKLVNGSSESKRCDTDSTASLQSDIFSDIPVVLDKTDHTMPTSVHNLNKQIKPVVSVSKESDHTELLSVSDNEPDLFLVDEKSKSNLTHSSSITRAMQIEKEIVMFFRMKCLLEIDESTKDFISKEITGVQCEGFAEPTLPRQKNNDTSASLADISGNDNKDASPGSVNSNPQLYQLNPSRLSFASTISSLSSVSSAASLAAKFAIRDSAQFSLPRAPAKHAKRHVQELHANDKQAVDETYERLIKEWQNSHLLVTTVLNFANAELSGTDTYNVSSERIDDQLQKIRSSTPEVPQEVVQVSTPKSSKKSKAVKRPRSKSAKSDVQSNGLNKVSAKALSPAEASNTPSRKKNKVELADIASIIPEASVTPLQQIMIVDELIGKEVFAKWSDNNYYPGKVIDKMKTKYKVNFYDGKNKILIEDFVIPIPKVLNEGLSVYATTKNDDYGSCGIIIDIETVNNEVHYTVETDEGDKIQVQVKDIFLSSDQAQVLKEEINSDSKSLPSTPKHLSQVSLDNMVDGKRRSRRIATPGLTTPKTKSIQTPTNKSIAEPSVSGMISTIKKQKKLSSESDGISSDSNVSLKDEMPSIGVQPEIIGTPYEQIKGPQNRIKSKSRSKRKAEDEETIATFGPIPKADSNLFKGMSFILTCASLETLDRYQTDIKDYGSDPGTENEEEWTKKPFARDRLKTQIEAGGGKVYADFNEIPQEEYKITKLITNVPNTTAKTLLCLSVGIPAYNHNWIIRCCQEGKIVNPDEDNLPAGWSLDKQTYIEMFQRPSNKPLTQVVVIIPTVESEKEFSTFWRQICENSGAVVLLADKPDSMEGFVEGTVVLTNSKCPSWAVEKANKLQIPLLSTKWIVQCLIEGKLCRYDSQSRYKYNCV